MDASSALVTSADPQENTGCLHFASNNLPVQASWSNPASTSIVALPLPFRSLLFSIRFPLVLSLRSFRDRAQAYICCLVAQSVCHSAPSPPSSADSEYSRHPLLPLHWVHLHLVATAPIRSGFSFYWHRSSDLT